MTYENRKKSVDQLAAIPCQIMGIASLVNTTCIFRPYHMIDYGDRNSPLLLIGPIHRVVQGKNLQLGEFGITPQSADNEIDK